jgi:hypothetical protein
MPTLTWLTLGSKLQPPPTPLCAHRDSAEPASQLASGTGMAVANVPMLGL